jgi:hypothetical protein
MQKLFCRPFNSHIPFSHFSVLSFYILLGQFLPSIRLFSFIPYFFKERHCNKIFIILIELILGLKTCQGIQKSEMKKLDIKLEKIVSLFL